MITSREVHGIKLLIELKPSEKHLRLQIVGVDLAEAGPLRDTGDPNFHFQCLKCSEAYFFKANLQAKVATASQVRLQVKQEAPPTLIEEVAVVQEQIIEPEEEFIIQEPGYVEEHEISFEVMHLPDPEPPILPDPDIPSVVQDIPVDPPRRILRSMVRAAKRKSPTSMNEDPSLPKRPRRGIQPAMRDPLETSTTLRAFTKSAKSNGILFSPNFYPCGICSNLVYTKFEDLKEHLRVEHNRAYPCTECSRSYDKSSSLYDHKMTHHYKTDLRCDRCNRYFSRPIYFNLHMRQHHTQETSKRKKEERPARHERLIASDEETDSATEGSDCTATASETETETSSEAEEAAASGGRTNQYKLKRIKEREMQELLIDKNTAGVTMFRQDFFPCGYCSDGNTFTDFSSLEQHNSNQHHRPWTCPMCPHAFQDEESREAHVQENHVQKRGFACELCGLVANSKKQLAKHVKAQHPVEQMDGFECSICQLKIKSWGGFKQHLRSHQVDRKCRYCGKEFKVTQMLIRHIRTHTGEKIHVCERCGRNYASLSAFLEHKRKGPAACKAAAIAAAKARKNNV